MAAAALIQQFPQVDGLESVRYMKDSGVGGSLRLCFSTVEKAQAFVQSFKFPKGNQYDCKHPHLGSFSTTTEYVVEKERDVGSPSKVFRFYASFSNRTVKDPTPDEFITLLKFIRP